MEIMKVNTPCPDAYVQLAGCRRNETAVSLPSTMIRATRYGKGRKRLNESSSGSTEGSPSMMCWNRGGEERNHGERGFPEEGLRVTGTEEWEVTKSSTCATLDDWRRGTGKGREGKGSTVAQLLCGVGWMWREVAVA